MFTIPDKLLKFICYFFYLLISPLLFQSCEKSTNPVISGQVTLTVEYIGVTEAYLRLRIKNIGIPLDFQLFRDDSLLQQGYLIATDTLLLDTLLLPAQSYSYQVILFKDTKPFTKSEMVSLTTLDTTSHDFQWEVIELPSPHGSGALYDVAIIDENNIWAVGEIYSDSAQPWLPYNAVHWDGEQWELKRINYSGSPWPIKSVFAFSSNEVWFDAFVRWNGTNFIQLPIPDILIGHGINKMWGTSNTDLYVVGSSGLIAHYDGAQWQRIESGTELAIKDIYGARKNENGQYKILCVAEHISPGGSKILSVENKKVRELPTNGLLSWGLWGIWFVPSRHYVVVGSGVWRSHLAEGFWSRDNKLPRLFSTSISGQGLNDIVVCGAFWFLAHWNGATWHTYFPRTSGSFTSIQIKQNLIIAVGGIERKAVIVSGKR